MALEALWMLELANQRGFRECAQHHVSRPGIPGKVQGAGFFDSFGRNAGSSGRSELAPETKSLAKLAAQVVDSSCRLTAAIFIWSGAGPPHIGTVPAFLDSREIGRARGFVGPRNGASRHHARPSALWGTHNSLMQNRLSATTLLGQEPKM